VAFRRRSHTIWGPSFGGCMIEAARLKPLAYTILVGGSCLAMRTRSLGLQSWLGY
jgi:hypothetical protein